MFWLVAEEWGGVVSPPFAKGGLGGIPRLELQDGPSCHVDHPVNLPQDLEIIESKHAKPLGCTVLSAEENPP